MQDAKAKGIEVTDDEKSEFRQNLIDQTYGSEEKFQAYLDEYNVSDDMFDRMVEEKLYYDKYLDLLKEDITVDAQSYYNENSDQVDVADQVDAKHILVETRKRPRTSSSSSMTAQIFLSSPRNTALTRRLLSRAASWDISPLIR